MILKQLFYYLQSFLFFLPGFGQKLQPQITGELHKDLGESSGIVLLPSGNFAQINDSGNPACILFTDTNAQVVDVECLPFVENRDWEDLAYGDGYLFVGDFGNNRNNRRDLKIYRLGITEDDSLYQAGEIKFRYSRQDSFPANPENRNFDMEAMVFAQDSLFLFSKNRTSPFTGYTYLYGFPAKPGNYTLSPLDSFRTGQGPMHLYWIGAAALNAAKSKLALLGYDKLWLFYNFRGTDFFQGSHREFHFKELSQKEAVTFLNDSVLIITDERADFFGGGYMYQLELPLLKTGKDWPVSLSPEKVFSDSIQVNLDKEVQTEVKWEIFNTEGQRVRYGRVMPGETESWQFSINTSELTPGGYVLNLIIAGRPHAFKLKKLLKTDSQRE